ncbi:MAG: YcxB family protein [Candidatus Limnocylindria bacterium]
MSQFEADYTITPQDAVDVSWTHARSTRRKVTLIGGLVAVVAFATWWLTTLPLALGLAAGVAMVVLLVNSRLFLRLQVRWTPATRVGSRYSIAVGAEGITFSVDGVSATVDWQAVTRVLEDKNAIVLMQGKVPVGVISKRGLGGPIAVEEFKRMVRAFAPDASWDLT